MNRKRSCLVPVPASIFLCLSLLPLPAAPAGRVLVSERVVERGPHHCTRETVEQISAGQNQPVLRTNRLITLGAGLHFRDAQGQWREARPEFEARDGRFAAKDCAFQASVAANVNGREAVVVTAPDGTRLAGEPIGLSYLDAASGSNVVFAEIKDSAAELAATNIILFQDCFSGGVKADVVFLLFRQSFEQLVVFREPPPSPVDYGLDPATVRLELLSEWHEPPAPRQETRVLKRETDPQKRQTMRWPDLTDTTLSFESLAIGPGAAFNLCSTNAPRTPSPQSLLERLAASPSAMRHSRSALRVAKAWEQHDQRHVLVESLNYPDLQPYLNRLRAPARQQHSAIRPPPSAGNHQGLAALVPPPSGTRKRLGFAAQR